MRIVPLYGEVVAATCEPRESVIQELEDALEAARSGHLQGIALARFNHDRQTEWSLRGIVNSFAMAGTIAVMASAQIEEVQR